MESLQEPWFYAARIHKKFKKNQKNFKIQIQIQIRVGREVGTPQRATATSSPFAMTTLTFLGPPPLSGLDRYVKIHLQSLSPIQETRREGGIEEQGTRRGAPGGSVERICAGVDF